LAHLLHEVGRFEEAIAAWQKAAVIQPELGLNLGNTLQAEGKQEAAIALYQQVIDSAPEKIEAYLSLAHLLNEMGQSQSALDTWKKAVALQPDLGLSLGDPLLCNRI